MNWFLVKIVYRIICGTGDHKAQFDEQLRLLQASDKQQALEKAKDIGISEQDTFLNNRQQLVQWKFINIAELYRLNEVIDGTEIYSRIEEKDDADYFEAMVNARAAHLLQEASLPCL